MARPSKISLDAHVDQKLAMSRDLRAAVPGEVIVSVADATADVLREQFPDIPELGRVVVAVLVTLDSAIGAFAMAGSPLSVTEAMAITGLAAEKLDREASRD